MMKMLNIKMRALILLLLFSMVPVTMGSDGDKKLHLQGRKYIHDRQWEKAVETYGELLTSYPGSLFNDDARFWIGFAYEQMPGKEKEAFDRYQKLVDSFPASPWVDDAVIHQVLLAKKLTMKGEQDYGRFLHEHISDPDSSIRYQTALAMGELRDPAALPVLEDMVQLGNPDMVRQAMNLMEGFSQTIQTAEEEGAVTLRKIPDASAPGKGRLFREKLGRKQGTWSEDLLYLNGLYHIVQREDLEFFISLENNWDREEWLRKFWAEQDPTPTTTENEAKDEFRRRVLFARENFGREWENDGYYYPPWDARGEVYIKYGKPDKRDPAEQGWEKWVYYDYRLTLQVAMDQTNINGTSVYPGTVSRYLTMRGMGLRGQQNINEPKFYYIDPFLKKAKNFDDMDFRFVSASSTGSMLNVVFTYSFPAANLNLKRDAERYTAAYKSEWVVYDEDYRKLQGKAAVNEIPRNTREKWNKRTVDERIEIVLPPGKYILALQVEDLHSNRLGIYKKTFSAQPRENQALLKAPEGN